MAELKKLKLQKDSLATNSTSTTVAIPNTTDLTANPLFSSFNYQQTVGNTATTTGAQSGNFTVGR